MPLLEYVICYVIWDNCNQYEKNELDKIQHEAARITTGATKLVSLDNLYKEVGWQTLHKQRHDHKITLFYKMFNQLTSVYLSSLIPQQVNAISHHNLRYMLQVFNLPMGLWSERRDPDNFPRFLPQEWCAWEIPEIAHKYIVSSHL